jgi:molybdate transport system ATP-binding protein
MIQARIRKRFPASPASAGFELHVEFCAARAVTALFGPSGSGKSLTFDCLAGFATPDEGRILLEDRIVFDAQAEVNLPPQQRGCGYVFQIDALFPHMSVAENLRFAARRLPRAERRRRTAELVERFRLQGLEGRRPAELSGGQKQRCSIVRALLASPRVLLLDEPAWGLDAELRTELYAVVRQVRSEYGLPVLLITHDLEECFELADTMLLYSGGRIVQAGPPQQIVQKPAGAEAARLLGVLNVLPVEVRALDPSRNWSLLRFDEQDFESVYYPGRLIGDRVHLCVPPQLLRARPADGELPACAIRARLERAVQLPGSIRLEFRRGLAVEMPLSEWKQHPHTQDWMVLFPPSGMTLV